MDVPRAHAAKASTVISKPTTWTATASTEIGAGRNGASIAAKRQVASVAVPAVVRLVVDAVEAGLASSSPISQHQRVVRRWTARARRVGRVRQGQWVVPVRHVQAWVHRARAARWGPAERPVARR